MILSSPTPFQLHILEGSFYWVDPVFPSHFFTPAPLTSHLPTWVPLLMCPLSCLLNVSTTLPSQSPTPPISPTVRPWPANSSLRLFCCPRSPELTSRLSWPPPASPHCCLATSLLASSPSLSLYLCLSQCLSPAVPPHSDTAAGKGSQGFLLSAGE